MTTAAVSPRLGPVALAYVPPQPLRAGNRGRGGRRSRPRSWRSPSSRERPLLTASGARALKIYTKTGDAGETGLIDGSRVSKDDLRVAAYGDVDELNAVLGVVRPMPGRAPRPPCCWRSSATCSRSGRSSPTLRAGRRAQGQGRGRPGRIEGLEAVDRRARGRAASAAGLRPAGRIALGAFLHLARTVCRRAERTIVAPRAQAPAGPADRLREPALGPALRPRPPRQPAAGPDETW